MSITIAFANQKGGVAKTLTTSCVARILTMNGYRVLCVDMDPQRNLSMTAGKGIAIPVDDTQTLNVIDVIEERCPIQSAIIHTCLGDLLRSSTLLTQWNTPLSISPDEYEEVRDNHEKLIALCDDRIRNQRRKQAKLYRALKKVQDDYDFILIDSNPSLTLVTLNCLYASDYIVVPALSEVTSIVAVSELINTVQTILSYSYDRKIEILGILMTRCEKRTSAYARYVDLYKSFSKKCHIKLFDSKIRKNARAADCIDAFSNLIDYDKRGTATQDYIKFVNELLIEIKERRTS